MHCKVLFEGDASGIFEMGMKTLREFLLKDSNFRIFGWFISETDARYQAVEVYHMLHGIYPWLCTSIYEGRGLVVRLKQASGMDHITHTVYRL